MMERLLFLYNPHSGQGKIKNTLSDIVDILTKAGYEVTIYPTQKEKDATAKVEAEAAQFDRIVCSGGDGTLDEVVTGLMRAKVSIPVGYIPAGSANDFGSSAGISSEFQSAAKTAAEGRLFPCDIGSFNDDFFVYVAAFGLFTEVSYTTSQEWKNALGYVAYIFEGAKKIVDIPSYQITAVCDDKEISGEFLVGMVTNSTYIGGVKGLIAEDVSLDDGLFEVMLIKSPKNPLEVSEILGFITNINRKTDLVFSCQAKSVRITSEAKVPWTLDGEFGGEHTEVAIQNLPKALQILIE